MEWVFLWLISIVVATSIGLSKKEGFSAFFLSLIFGPLAVLFAILSIGKHRHPCPFCKELIMKGAKICPHCRGELSPISI